MRSTRLPGPRTWFCIRRDGAARREGWIDGVSLPDLRTRLGARSDDVVEACIAGDTHQVTARRFSSVFFPRARGLIGMEIKLRGETLRLSPMRMLATNLSFGRALDRFLKQHGAEAEEFRIKGELGAFSARQYLLPSNTEDGPVELFRGSTLVKTTPSSHENRAANLADGIGQWTLANLSVDGGLPYKYWPSRGTESPADNAIRRFLASLSLARLGDLRGSPEIREGARRNLRFNLKRYFRDIGGGRGAIVERTGAKLGAAAVAALAILENAASEEFSRELTMLATGIDSLADDERGFRTFFFPSEREGENWNFYSGEALLFWAEAARRGISIAPSLERCAAAFERCRDRHRRCRNPAFVPWHSQACTSLYAQTRHREYADFVFEMNDWLLSMQQWDGLDPDLKGRFYDPRHPEFGPPHAASTGAYLEGLGDAMALAFALRDERRATTYERSVHRGLRSLRQLQFRDERDAFYVSKRSRVLGALRTEVYDNAIRVDSAAHALLAAIKFLRPTKIGSTRHSPSQ
ncbi:MAG: hypothetical protein OXQ84_20370 [bacterium]|nr:hypothetical protein [bacterium]